MTPRQVPGVLLSLSLRPRGSSQDCSSCTGGTTRLPGWPSCLSPVEADGDKVGSSSQPLSWKVLSSCRGAGSPNLIQPATFSLFSLFSLQSHPREPAFPRPVPQPRSPFTTAPAVNVQGPLVASQGHWLLISQRVPLRGQTKALV